MPAARDNRTAGRPDPSQTAPQPPYFTFQELGMGNRMPKRKNALNALPGISDPFYRVLLGGVAVLVIILVTMELL